MQIGALRGVELLHAGDAWGHQMLGRAGKGLVSEGA